MAKMGYPFFIDLSFSNLTFISSIVNVMITRYHVFANENTYFRKLSLVIFLRFSDEFGRLSLIFLKIFFSYKEECVVFY